MESLKKRKLVLEGGREFYGCGFGYGGDVVCEIVFNTSVVGYQEILSDPSYTDQGVIMTYPLIGNYGTADDDYESKSPSISALIVREYNDFPSNFRYTRTLSEVMEEYDIAGLSEIDTRALARSIRKLGSRRGIITDADTDTLAALDRLSQIPQPHDAVARVSCKKRWYSRTAGAKYNIVAVDCGIKLGIIRQLNQRGCNVTVVPYNISPEDVIRMKPDGIFLSNGPGDPEDVPEVVGLIRALRGKYPIFGICLGHQLICLAYGGRTYKLKFGHRGGNHPVKNLLTGKVEITSQNHSYAVSEIGLEGTGIEVTHINLLDGTVEGVRDKEGRIFSVQYHPESAPGPQDSTYLFDEFIKLLGGK